ncbi:MAG: AMMECR1 domain-containing protein [Candidatus Altiarchaeales archaeon ex4484_2]|nr:MAG: AMMECR1 domain-containing protein [Candidatus Altiarchaeales archaeon ex4484_2]
MELTKKQGTVLVKYIRKTLEEYFKEKTVDIKDYISEDMRDVVSREAAAYVTLFKYPSMRFRGSSGHMLPILSLEKTIREATLKAAFRDRRFIPLMKSELRDTIVELSQLRKPVKIEADSLSEYPSKIKIGRDGIAIEKGYTRALLLPQTAVMMGWNAKQFLSFALLKAGLDPRYKSKNIQVYRVQAQVFREEKPGGDVIEEEFN